jgi:cyclase
MSIRIVLVCAACFTFFLVNSQTDDGRETNTSIKNVENGIYMVEGNGGNVAFSAGVDGILMIDAQYAEGAEALLKDIRRVSDEPIKFLVNTHAHRDHTGANALIAAEGATIVSHIGVRDAFLEKIRTSDKGDEVDMAAFPTVTFEDKMSFHMNEDTILVFHVDNAHTDGDAVVYFTDSNVIHAGDLFFNGKYPYIDAKEGGSVKGYIDGLEKILMLCDNETKIIPGHGKLGTKANLNASKNMLANLHRKVTYNYLLGKTEAEILAMRDFTSPYDTKGYGSGFISTKKILKTIYDEVSKEQSDFDPRSMEKRLKELESQNKNGNEKAMPKDPYKRRIPTEAEKEAVRKKKERAKEAEEENGGGL